VFVVYQTTFFNFLIGFMLNPKWLRIIFLWLKKIKKFAAGK